MSSAKGASLRRTFEMCVPSDLWMPEHWMQTSAPCGITAQVGAALPSPQSAQTALAATSASARSGEEEASSSPTCCGEAIRSVEGGRGLGSTSE
eukprot:1574670-Pleurochrysis_carterae.AAC.1